MSNSVHMTSTDTPGRPRVDMRIDAIAALAHDAGAPNDRKMYGVKVWLRGASTPLRGDMHENAVNAVLTHMRG